MGRSPCCAKEGLNRGAWTALEDRILTSYINTHGEGKWRNLPKKAGLKRCGKSCRLRWLNYLRPDIKRGNISHDEEELIIRLHNLLGNRWSLIAGRLPGRTDNEIKNYWNTTLGKRAKAEASTQTSPTNSRQSNPNPKPKPKPKPKAAASETKIQVIRTKATRFSTKILLPSQSVQPPPTPADTNSINHLTLHHRPIFQLQHHSLYGSDDGDILNLGSINNINNQMEAINNDIMIDKDLSLDPVQQSLPFDEAFMFHDWISNANANANANCLDGDDNAAMDLDSLAFLLDPPDDEWP